MIRIRLRTRRASSYPDYSSFTGFYLSFTGLFVPSYMTLNQSSLDSCSVLAWTGLRWALFGKPGKGGISGPGLKMDLNANIGLTFTPIEWGNEHKHILSAIPQGKSVFITGSAGIGKSLLLEEIKK
ncbi:hypothetical protein Fmac_024785 [Flemingia macrophylla]|uniref:Uncharacterized protein n=1 Tax=Flemingia macrophylla TaxID=520843 RepID=A0ABD1LQC7_9FABA